MSFLGKLFGRPGGAPAQATTRARGPLATDSGMWALWDHARFAQVTGYDTWEPELLENDDILRHVEAGALVPINIGSDGVFEFEVRVGSAGAPAELSERERRYLTVSSEPYRFVATGKAFVSGIEHIHGEPEPGSTLPLRLGPGTYAVTVHMIAWDDEPGSKDAAGNPAATALADFVLLISPAAAGTDVRRELETFPPPPA